MSVVVFSPRIKITAILLVSISLYFHVHVMEDTIPFSRFRKMTES
jgi:hypothetical protein